MRFSNTRAFSLVALSALAVSACDDDDAAGTGRVRVSLDAEETITEGLTVGDGVSNSKDYAVSYSKYLVAVGGVALTKSSSDQTEADDMVYVADLKRVGTQGVELFTFANVSAGQWDGFAYETVAARAGAKALAGVSDEDRTLMIDNGWTYWIEGTVERASAEGGSVDFVIQTAVPTRFGECGVDGELGLAVPRNGTATGAITLHGDHLWFNSFPSGNEGSVERRAAWILAADVDGDGMVVTEDLALLDATEVFTSTLGYSLDGAPTRKDGTPLPIETALDFVRAQLATQGHFNGEGECIWSYGGASGDDGHEHDDGHDHDHD